MSEKGSNKFQKYFQMLMRFSFLTLLLSIVFLFVMLVGMVSRLETLLPAELRLLLEILKNRLFQ